VSVTAGVPKAAVLEEQPHNLEAEESVLGALMLVEPDSPVVDEVNETGLRAGHFLYPSHRRLYVAINELHAAGEPADVITLSSRLDADTLKAVGGKDRLHELATIVPATTMAPRYARIVRDTAQTRALMDAANEVERLARSNTATPAQLLGRAQELFTELAEDRPTALEPLWWHDAIHEPLPETQEYVDGVLQAGILADIVGLPYLHKSAIALELATKVARGQGLFLNKYAIRAQAPVAYWWSDDSRRQELERIQNYAAELDANVVPLGFYLNTGIRLPEDIAEVKHQIRRHGYRLVVFDSLYNFAPGIDWVKDTRDVANLYAQLKRLCDQVEGLTIVLVDHASKPSDSNKGRAAEISSFGSVWKAAAVRCSIIVTKDNGKLHVQATGNNVRGFPKTLAEFDRKRLEVYVVEPDPEVDAAIQEAKDAELRQAILDYVEKNPNVSTTAIRESPHVAGSKDRITAAILKLEADGHLVNTIQELEKAAPEPLRAGPGGSEAEAARRRIRAGQKQTAWIRVNQAEKAAPDAPADGSGLPAPARALGSPGEPARTTPPPFRGEGDQGGRHGESPTTNDPRDDLFA
jgi:hypothetical protein